jgi:hypothetical protein
MVERPVALKFSSLKSDPIPHGKSFYSGLSANVVLRARRISISNTVGCCDLVARSA